MSQYSIDGSAMFEWIIKNYIIIKLLIFCLYSEKSIFNQDFHKIDIELTELSLDWSKRLKNKMKL